MRRSLTPVVRHLLLVAVTLGVLNAVGPWGLLSDGLVTTDQLTRLPLSLIPTFGVPFLLVVHLLSLARLRTHFEDVRQA